MLARLNGWQRLWVLVAALHLIAVSVLAVMLYPSSYSHQIRQADFAVELALRAQVEAAQAAGDQRAELNALRNLERGAGIIRLESYSDLSEQDVVTRIRSKLAGTAHSKTLEERIASDADELGSMRFTFILQALAWWFVPIIVVYALGMAIGWVVRGFHERREV